MHFLNCKFTSVVVASFCIGIVTASPVAPVECKNPAECSVKSPRATCADPSLAQTVSQAFRTDTFVHGLNYHFRFAGSNAVNQQLKYADVTPAFRAFPTQQDSTLPLFQLGTADRKQYIYRFGANANSPPTVSGFNTDVGVITWAYNTQICGTVPLYSLLVPASSSRYYTISTFERSSLLSSGWADDGVVAYVFP